MSWRRLDFSNFHSVLSDDDATFALRAFVSEVLLARLLHQPEPEGEVWIETEGVSFRGVARLRKVTAVHEGHVLNYTRLSHLSVAMVVGEHVQASVLDGLAQIMRTEYRGLAVTRPTDSFWLSAFAQRWGFRDDLGDGDQGRLLSE